MRVALHILNRQPEEWTREIIGYQQNEPETRTVVADLTVEKIDYKELLVNIFTADSVASW